MSKTLEEVIEKILINIILEDAVDPRLVKEISKFTAIEILRAAEEWCAERDEAARMNSDNENWCKGMRDLNNFLKQYINGKAEVQG